MQVFLRVAAGLGFEPRYTDPESVVLPLDDPAIIEIALSRDFYHTIFRCAHPPRGYALAIFL